MECHGHATDSRGLAWHEGYVMPLETLHNMLCITFAALLVLIGDIVFRKV